MLSTNGLFMKRKQFIDLFSFSLLLLHEFQLKRKTLLMVLHAPKHTPCCSKNVITIFAFFFFIKRIKSKNTKIKD